MSEAETIDERKIRWTTIKVPVELRDKINELAQRLDKPAWKVIMNAISFFDEQLRNPRLKETLPMVDKVSWYIAKIGMSVGEFKANPTNDNLERLKKTAQQIQERLGVDVGLLIRVAEAYMRDPNPDNRMELNATLKMLILDIIYKKLVREE